MLKPVFSGEGKQTNLERLNGFHPLTQGIIPGIKGVFFLLFLPKQLIL